MLPAAPKQNAMFALLSPVIIHLVFPQKKKHAPDIIGPISCFFYKIQIISKFAPKLTLQTDAARTCPAHAPIHKQYIFFPQHQNDRAATPNELYRHLLLARLNVAAMREGSETRQMASVAAICCRFEVSIITYGGSFSK